MEIVQVYECGCHPGYHYSTKNTFNSHKKTMRHQVYINQEEKLHARKKIHNLEIEVAKLKRECMVWKEKYLELSLKHDISIDLLS